MVENKLSELDQAITETISIDPKPCPFCGPKMVEHLVVMDSKEGIAKVVKCWACGAVGPYGASNEKLAVEFWNNRAD